MKTFEDYKVKGEVPTLTYKDWVISKFLGDYFLIHMCDRTISNHSDVHGLGGQRLHIPGSTRKDFGKCSFCKQATPEEMITALFLLDK